MRSEKIIGWICLFLFINQFSFAQECGPFCPVCSGTGSSTGALVAPGDIVSNLLYIPNGEDEIGVINFRGGVTSWLDLGVGYTIEAEKVLWSCRLQLIKEKESSLQPAIVFGTGSVQTGKSDQSLFLQISKARELNEWFAIRFFLGIAGLMPDFEDIYGIAGLKLTITERWNPFLSYDGISFHPGLVWIPTDWLSLSGILVESKEPAISVAFRFSMLKDSN